MKNRLIIFVSSILVVVTIILIVIGVFNKSDVKGINISPNTNNVNYNSQFKDINPDSHDIDISQLKLQKDEVSDVKYFSKNELIERINNNYDELTEKTSSWHFLKKILEDA